VAGVPLENRATIGNMSPEYGSTITVFPIDTETLRYLRFTGRPDDLVALVEAYAKEQGMWHDDASPEPAFSERLELDLGSVSPSLAGPKRPQDRIPLDRSKAAFRAALAELLPANGDPVADEPSDGIHNGTIDETSAESFPASDPPAPAVGANGSPAHEVPPATPEGSTGPDRRRSGTATMEDRSAVELRDGHVVIAAITSCTNTSNPSVMMAAALLARNAVERGLEAKPWVKRSLAPGSRVVMDYYERSGLVPYLEKLGFDLVGYGCTTCIGNSGPLLPGLSEAVQANDLAVASILSGNRNFEGRINPDCRMNFLASPPLVVAYALVGTVDWDPYHEPLGQDADGTPVFLRDIWPTGHEVAGAVRAAVESDMFRRAYAEVFTGDDAWRSLDIPEGQRFAWDEDSTYVRRAPFFEGMPADPEPLADVRGARVLAVLGDSVTTDHISPAGSIKADSPGGRWLVEHGVQQRDFNSYGSRRGNHEVMVRGTFANIRIRNRLVPGVEGGMTRYLPTGEAMTIYEASQRYLADGTPLVVLAGKEYGSGSSRDWAAKGPLLQGVRAVIAESFERIHRSNLIGMGILPLQLPEGETVDSLGLSGEETFEVTGLEGLDHGRLVGHRVRVAADGRTFDCLVRIDTPKEADYFHHGGILQYVLRGRLAEER
jgi:aconitate hydratase